MIKHLVDIVARENERNEIVSEPVIDIRYDRMLKAIFGKQSKSSDLCSLFLLKLKHTHTHIGIIYWVSNKTKAL